MITHDVEQGSPEWQQLRLGIPTASEFGRILTPTGKVSTQADGYMHKLLAEWLTGKPLETFDPTPWMERGQALEAQAVAYYELQTNVTTTVVGFCTNDDCATVGCSPDRLVGESGGLEVKCPSPGVQVEYLLANKLPTKYIPQLQGNMLVTDRSWWDFLAWHEDLPPVLIRVPRDQEYINKLTHELTQFWRRLDNKRQELIAKGYTPELTHA
jgi:hypothetical protein